MAMETVDRKRTWLIITIVALKIILVLLMPAILSLLGKNYMAGNFPDEYGAIASNLISGNGYRVFPETSPTMLRQPGFILILAALLKLAGKNIVVVQAMHVLMSFATAWLVYLTASRLFKKDGVAIVAALIFLFHPLIMIAESRAGFECTLILFFTASVYFSVCILQEPTWKNFILFGILFSIALQIRGSIALYFPLFMLMAFYWEKCGLSIYDFFKRFAISGLISAALLMPWIIRNYQISEHFVPTMSLNGSAVYQGIYVAKHYDGHKDLGVLLDEAVKEQYRLADEMGLKTSDKAFMPLFYNAEDEINYYNRQLQLGGDELKANPGLLWTLFTHNAWSYWFLGRTQTATLLNFIAMTPLLVFALFGVKLAFRFNAFSWLLLIAIFSNYVTHLFTLSLARYSATVIPFCAIFAALAVYKTWSYKYQFSTQHH